MHMVQVTARGDYSSSSMLHICARMIKYGSRLTWISMRWAFFWPMWILLI